MTRNSITSAHDLADRRAAIVALASVALTACQSRPDHLAPLPTPFSPEDRALQYKFRGLRGGQLRVDSLFEIFGLNLFDEQRRLFYNKATLRPPANSILSYGADFGVPKFLRVEWRDKASTFRASGPSAEFVGGTILGEHTVPVAARIPDDLLESKRRHGGGFRLKVRIHPDGPLIGWDLERGMGSAPDGSRFHFPGGDFCEADIYQGRVLRRGWYIHPKTGQKIETDF